MIDLRSDTVSKPNDSMRKVIQLAEVGDDVIGDDPTVQRLEQLSAQTAGKDAALYVPSGTMGNLIALLVHCQTRKAAIVGSESHILWHEGLGATALGGIHLISIENESDGKLSDADLDKFAQDKVADPAVVCIENTHNRCGGRVLDEKYLSEIANHAHRLNAKVHMDGARIFNAALALNCEITDLTRNVDSVSFCFSKGLGAPIGSVLCGDNEFIKQARIVRRNLGGGMRQVGMIASAAEYALQNNVKRLIDDHSNAKIIADALSKFPQIEINVNEVETNIIYFNLNNIDGDIFEKTLAEKGLYVSRPKSKQEVRIVTHIDINEKDIKQAIEILESVITSLSS
ncbi:MAG: threonine aldolase [Chloroflexi bacterium]|nr:threonine aldolase [Chloroflexota bacterium]|tara:strand:- start:1601 stop:2629 length:1029 start_codon:yes stop_codon:yes gene_type:complete